MSIEKKSVVEEALLQIKAVEEAISENAKGILASTMKEEISELVKESLNGSKKSKRSLYEQEEVPVDVEDEDEEDLEDEEGTDDEDDLGVDIEDETEFEVPTDVMGPNDNEDEIAPLDMTSASPEEVLKVFKAMGDDDGIIVKKEGSLVKLTDNDTNKDYIIQTESDKRRKRNMKSKLNETSSDRFENLEDLDFSEFEERPRRPRPKHDEVEYELELDDLSNDDEEEVDFDFKRPSKKYSMMDESDDEDENIYELEMEESEDDDEDEELEESFKPKGKVGKMKFSYPKSMKKGVTETSDEDEELDEDWDLEEGEDLISYPSSPKEMGEGSKPKGNVGKMKDFKYPKSMKKGVTETEDEDEELEENWDEKGETTEASRTMTYRRRAERNRVAAPKQVRSESVVKEMSLLREKNEEYRKALDFFRNKLNEVAVFNSNLAYSTRLFTEHSTTKQEKINILRRFDNVESIKESKNLYKTIKSELDGKNVGEVVTESIQRKVNKTPQTGSATNLIESKTYENPQFMRMKDLMSKIK
jgi:hypothetical protein